MPMTISTIEQILKDNNIELQGSLNVEIDLDSGNSIINDMNITTFETRYIGFILDDCIVLREGKIITLGQS